MSYLIFLSYLLTQLHYPGILLNKKLIWCGLIDKLTLGCMHSCVVDPPYICMTAYIYIPYSRKPWGRKLSWIFEDWKPSTKFCLRNLGACRTHLWLVSINPWKFLQQILTSYRSAKVFFLESLPLYSIDLFMIEVWKQKFSSRIHPSCSLGRKLALTPLTGGG